MWPPTRAREPGRTTFPSAHGGGADEQPPQRASTYIGTLLYGSLATLERAEIENEPAAVDAGGAGVESHEGGAGEDHLCGRRAGPHQARHLHHQGESHLRSDPRRPERGRQAGGQRRPEPGHVRRGHYAQRAQAGAAVRRARQLLRLRRGIGRRARVVECGHRLGLPGEDLAAELSRRTSAPTTTRAWWPTAIRCCRRFPT